MNALPKIETHHPSVSRLQPIIDYYYFLSKKHQRAGFDFWYYPHYNSTLLILKNTNFNLKGHTEHITPSPNKKLSYAYSYNTLIPRKVIVSDPCDLIGIVFKPLGINNYILNPFVNNSVDDIISTLDKSLSPEIKTIFQSQSIESKRLLLEQLLIDELNEFQAPTLQQAISEILLHDGHINLSELCVLLKINRRTLSRYFRLHLGITFREFKAIVKFRTALNKGILKSNKGNMSDIAFEANYYDQSDFIKHFKSKTNETPKHMLKTISKVTDELLWKML